jgi:MinD-like ATPase involved in chromosome partitioning or flagellar assembly
MAEIIAFVSIKGGVGKTTVALETASSLVNDFGKKVLLVDANFSAPNIGLYLDLTNEFTLQDSLSPSGTLLHNAIYEAHGIDIIPSSLYYGGEIDVFKLKKILGKFKSRYDFIILDSSPNYEELKPVVAAADKIFIVTTPDDMTLKTSLKAAVIAKENETPIEGLIVNRIRSSNYEYDLNEIEKISKIPVMAKILDNKGMAESLYRKKPITILNSRSPIAREIKRFTSAISGNPEEKGFVDRFFIFKNLMGKEKVNRELLRQKLYEEQL